MALSSLSMHERGRLAGLTYRRPADDPEIATARLNFRAARLEDQVRDALAVNPPLTYAQRRRLVMVLLDVDQAGEPDEA